MAIRMWKVGAVTALAALTSACASMGGKRTEPDESLTVRAAFESVLARQERAG
jgi:hypothetical protein